MPKILILYGSTTGNTEMVAEQIMSCLEEHEVDLQDVADASQEDLASYDLLVVGASTWDDGKLQQDFRDFVDGLDVDLSDKKAAVFGLGDSTYPDFCKAAPILEQIFTNLGAKLVVDALKIDGFPDEVENEEKIDAWSQELAKQI